MANPSDQNEGTDEAPEGFCHLGNFEAFEAERLLKRFEESGVRFQIDQIEERVFTSGGRLHGAGYVTRTAIAIYAHKEDEQKALAIVKEDWKV